MKLKYIILTVLCVFSLTAESACIVLLHGLARTENSMNYLQDQLENEGYKVVNIGYPSREHAIDALAKKAIVPALQLCNAENEINKLQQPLQFMYKLERSITDIDSRILIIDVKK